MQEDRPTEPNQAIQTTWRFRRSLGGLALGCCESLGINTRGAEKGSAGHLVTFGSFLVMSRFYQSGHGPGASVANSVQRFRNPRTK